MINSILNFFGYNKKSTIPTLNPNIEVWDGKKSGTLITIRGQTGNSIYEKTLTGYTKHPEFYNKQILLTSEITVKDLYDWYYTKKFIEPINDKDKNIHKYFSFIIYPKNGLSYRILNDNEIVNGYKVIWFVFTGNRRA